MVEKKTTTKAKPKKATKATTKAKKTVSASEKRVEALKKENKVLSDKVSDLVSENKSLKERITFNKSLDDAKTKILKKRLGKYEGAYKKRFIVGLFTGLSLMFLASLIS